MSKMFGNTVWGWVDRFGRHHGIKQTVFSDEGVKRLSEVFTLIERMKVDKTGYIRFHRDREVCTITCRGLTLDCHGIPYRSQMTLEKVVAILTPSGSIELHNKYTGRLYCTMTADPQPEWVEYQMVR